MADPAPQRIDPPAVIDGLVRDLVRGDQALRRASLMPVALGLTLGHPAVLLAPRMHGKLSFIVSTSQEKRLLFLFKTDANSDRLADIRVRFTLTPSMAPAATTRASAIAVELEPPTYLLDSGDADRLHLDLHGPLEAQVTFLTAKRLRVRLSDDATSHDTAAVWPLEVSMALIDGIAEHARNDQTGPPRPFEPPADAVLTDILRTIVDGYHQVIGNLNSELKSGSVSRANDALRTLHPDLGANYRFAELFSRVLVWIGKDGKVALDRAPADGHQLDVEARLLPLADNYALRYRFRIPDLVAGGDYHQHFLRAVRETDHTNDFFKHSRKVPGKRWTAEVFRAFVDHAQQDASALFVRIGRGADTTHRRKPGPLAAANSDFHDEEIVTRDNKDRNLVVLRGPLAGQWTELLFETRITVSAYPEIEVTGIDVVALIGFCGGATAWQPQTSGADLPKQYVTRLLLTLRGWQRGMTQAALR